MAATERRVWIRVALLLALMVVSVASIATVSFLAFSRIGSHVTDAAHLQALALQRVELTSTAQRNFLVQVQEWKNLLLRRHDELLFEKHRAAFEQRAAAVRSDLATLAPLLRLPANRERVRDLLAAHAELLQRYHAALATFDRTKIHNEDAVDELVRGIDRPLTAGFDALREGVEKHARESAEVIVTGADAAEARARRLISVVLATMGLCALLAAFCISRSLLGVMKQRQAAETLLEQSEGRHRQLVDLAPCAVLVECDGRWVFANPKAVEMLGANSAADLLGRTVFDSIHPNARSAAQENMRLWRAGVPQRKPTEGPWRRLDGSRFIGEATAAPYIHEGKPGVLLILRDITARKTAEAQRDQFFSLAVDLLCIAGADGSFKRVNPAFGVTLGWTDKELLSRPFIEFVHPDDVAATLSEVAKLAAGDSTHFFENRYRCKNGTWRWLAWSAVADHGVIYATARDLTAGKAAEAALLASEKFNRSIVESSQDCLEVLSLEGRLLHMNSSGHQLVDPAGVGHVVDADWLDLLQGAEREAAATAIASARAGGSGRFTRIVKTSGELTRWWEVTISAIHGADGAPQKLLVVSRDNTLQHQAEAAIVRLNADLETRVEERTAELQFQQAFLRKVIDLNQSLIYAKDREGRYVLLNEATARVYRMTVEAMLGKTDVELHLDKTLAEHLRRQDQTVFDTARELVIDEEPMVATDGRTRWWSTLKRPILSADGKSDMVLGVTTEVTRRKTAEAKILALNADLERRVAERTNALESSNRQLAQATAEAEQASRAKSAFLATMSHEIRTPMNGVIGMSDVLAQSELAADQADAVAIIRTSAFSLLRIIDDVLDFSKIEAGRLDLERVAVDLPELVRGARDTLSAAASAKGVELQLTFDSNVPGQVRTDPTRLRQVLFNLVGNAIKCSTGRPHLPGKVALRVEVASTQPLRVAFSVADNGVGISAEALEGLFMPFVQAESSTTRRFGGTGLGLVISKRLVDLLGGEIAVRSEPGAGSTFTVTLPLEIVDPALSPPADAGTALRSHRPAAAPADGAQPGPGSRRILIAEDDEINQKVIRRQLALLGYSADVAADGAQALALWRAGDYALLITDLHMPEMDGYALAHAIRRDERAPGSARPSRIPILALTANALRGEADRVRAAGMDDYLTKPIQLLALRAAIEPWLTVPGHLPAEASRGAKQTSAASVVPAVDLAVLEALVGDDDATVSGFLADYLGAARLQGAKLLAACAAADSRQVAAIAHRLKSSSRSIGALILGGLCDAIESSVSCESHAELLQRMGPFERSLREVENFIVARLAIAHKPRPETIR